MHEVFLTMIKRLLIPFLTGSLLLAGCSEEPQPDFKVGVVSDIECEIENAKISATHLKLESIDMMLIAGDVYENEQLRGRASICPASIDNVKEMVEGITPYAQLGVPVYVIAGNHEEQAVYKKAITQLNKQFPNVHDITKLSVDLEGLNIVGLGGYHHPRFTAPKGYLLKEGDYEWAYEQLQAYQSQEEPILFVTHGPPFSKSRIDYVYGTGHVGDKNLTLIMNGDLDHIVNAHGHIHQGGGHQDTTYKAGTSINVASVTSFLNPRAPRTGIISFHGMETTYDVVQ